MLCKIKKNFPKKKKIRRFFVLSGTIHEICTAVALTILPQQFLYVLRILAHPPLVTVIPVDEYQQVGRLA